MARFKIGLLLMTREVADAVPFPLVQRLVRRHAAGDWGEALSPEDREANELALKEGSRLLSAYHTPHGKIWIITERDRSATTVLFPDDY